VGVEKLVTVASSAHSPGAAGRVWWQVLGPLGIGLAAVGVMNALLVWIPPDLDNPSWAYSAAASFLERAVLLATGAAILAAAAVASGQRQAALGAAVLLLFTALISIFSGAILKLNLDAAMPASGSPIRRVLMKRSYYESTAQALILTGISLLIGLKTLGWARKLRRIRKLA
jgi:hypothetical protein